MRKHIINGKITSEAKDSLKLYLNTILLGLANKGVYCMTEVPDSLLMWSHYGDSHQGYCIEYERTPDNLLGIKEPFFNELFPKSAETKSITNKVVYSNSYPKLRLSYFSFVSEFTDFFKLLLTKGAQWSYEKEWRLFNDRGDISYPAPAKIKSIIFGLRMLDENKKMVMDVFKSKSEITFKCAIKAGKSYSVSFVEL